MTCIIGLEHEGSVYMGGDSAGVADLFLQVRTDPKVFINKDFIFGFTSSFRMGQILQYDFIPPKHPPKKSDMAYLVTDFITAVRVAFSSKGFISKNEERETGGNFLMGYRGKLYEVDCDFQVGKQSINYASVGCGAELAAGAMHALADVKDPIERITRAMDAAEYFSTGVSKPYLILKLPPQNKPKTK